MQAKTSSGKGPAAEQPWSVPVPIIDLPPTGRRVELEAPADALPRIADFTAVRSVVSLTATFDLRPHATGLRISGRVRGRVGQTCVVTLEPMETDIDETVDVSVADAPGPLSGDIVVAPNDEDTDVVARDGRIDLGELAVEFSLLGIDPYPRKPGVEFVASEPADDPREHPFAALARLKRPPEH